MELVLVVFLIMVSLLGIEIEQVAGKKALLEA